MSRVTGRLVLVFAAILAAIGVPDRPAAQQRPVDPPTIQFSYPLADAKLQTETTAVTALVTDELGVMAIELTVNGEREPSVVASDPPTPAVLVNLKDVPLGLGENVLALSATNKAGKSAQVVRVVTRVPAAVATEAPPPSSSASRSDVERWAVVIGVGVYDNPQIPRLRFAENDARALYSFLTTKGGYKKDNVLLITDTSQKKPTLLNMKRGLGEWLYRRAGQDDEVLIYFVGHGAPGFMIPRDTDPASLFVTGFALDDLGMIIKRLLSKRVLLLVDACFSGAANGRTSAKAMQSPLVTSDLPRRDGLTVVNACGPNDVAMDIPQEHHGLFTYYLLKGLGGEADADDDGVVTADELSDYVRTNVTRVPATVVAIPRSFPVLGVVARRVGERYAVVIGVGAYDNPKIPKLRYAENDARAVYDLLTTKGGYEPENVRLITDGAGLKPTLANIKRALGAWLYRRASRDDTVLVYFAGHGAPEVDPDGADRDGLAKYLIPRDADPESLLVTSLAVDDIASGFHRIESDRILFLLDTSFSGAAGGRTFTPKPMPPRQLTSEFLDRLAPRDGRVVISAAGPNEPAREAPQLKHGLFTYYVLKGLEGDADADSDGVVTIDELFDYVRKNVARDAKGKQTPVMIGAGNDVPLVQGQKRTKGAR